jgi:hypothetical protein
MLPALSMRMHSVKPTDPAGLVWNVILLGNEPEPGAPSIANLMPTQLLYCAPSWALLKKLPT